MFNVIYGWFSHIKCGNRKRHDNTTERILIAIRIDIREEKELIKDFFVA